MKKHVGETPDMFQQEHIVISDQRTTPREASVAYRNAQKLPKTEEKK